MLRYRALFHFMLRHHPQLASEIRQAYMNTMRWYYGHHFERFKRALEKIKIENRVEMIGNDDPRKGLFSTSKTGTISMNDPFHLGDRMDILKEGKALISIQPGELDSQVYPCLRFKLSTVPSGSVIS